MSNILEPVEPPFASDVEAILTNYPQQEGYILSLFRTFANSVRFLSKAVPNLLDKASPLSLREREIVILRTTANNDCEYEWGVHVSIFARSAKLSLSQIASTKTGTLDEIGWNEAEKLLIGCIDDLCNEGIVTEENLPHWQKFWTKEQQLEIFALCGTYHTISFVANSARLANEEFGATFPLQKNA